MSGGVASAFSVPHVFRDPHQSPLPTYPLQPNYITTPAPAFPTSSTMSSRKRKASDDADLADIMSSSPTPSPSTSHRNLNSPLTSRITKRARTHTTARPLPLNRLLETLSPDQLRSVLTTLCARNPSLAAELTSTAPRPSVPSALAVLQSYDAALRESFPYGDRPTSDYSFNRVRPSLLALLDALRDYVPQFLPPQEIQTASSLQFLDGVTGIVASLPVWDSWTHNRYRDEAFEELGAAWALVIREAGKKGAGIQLQVGGWEGKVARWNEVSSGKMAEAVHAMRECLAWGVGMTGQSVGSGQGQQEVDDRERVRRELFGGTYGSPVQVGPW